MLGEIARLANACGIVTCSVSLLDVTQMLSKGSRTIMGAELEEPLLADIGSNELAVLQHLIKNASSTIWVTNGGRLEGSDPKQALASGILKTLMNEQPSFQMSCFDIETDEVDLARSAAFIVDQHLRLFFEETSQVDMDLVERNGMVYISRFLPDDVRNAAFERQINPPVELGVFSPSPALELDFQKVGQVDSFYYKKKDDEDESHILQPGEILLEPEVFSLSALVCQRFSSLSASIILIRVQEAAVLRGQQESEFFSHEFVATVRTVGSEIFDFRPGDRVLSLSPGKFDTSIVVKKESCHKLLPKERFEDICGAFVPLCSAIYALRNLSRVKKGQVRVFPSANTTTTLTDAGCLV